MCKSELRITLCGTNLNINIVVVQNQRRYTFLIALFMNSPHFRLKDDVSYSLASLGQLSIKLDIIKFIHGLASFTGAF